MFADQGSVSEGQDANAPEASEPKRQQYTLKGVEKEAVELMRNAARKDGMKIGAWVSMRMKEAAQRSLHAGSSSPERCSDDISSSVEAGDFETLVLLTEIHGVVAQLQDQLNAKFQEIDAELHGLTSGQRAIMSNLLSQPG